MKPKALIAVSVLVSALTALVIVLAAAVIFAATGNTDVSNFLTVWGGLWLTAASVSVSALAVIGAVFAYIGITGRIKQEGRMQRRMPLTKGLKL